MEKLNVPEFSFKSLPFVFEYTTNDGGVYQQKAFSYVFENNFLTFLCQVNQMLDTGEMTSYTTGFFSVSNVKTVRLVDAHFDTSNREIKAPKPPEPPPAPTPIIIQTIAPTSAVQAPQLAQVANVANGNTENIAPTTATSSDIEIRQPEKTVSKPKIKLDFSEIQKELNAFDDENAQIPNTPTTQEISSPLSALDDDDIEPSSITIPKGDETGVSGEEWAISKVGHDVKQQQYDLFMQGLGAFIKEHEKNRPLPFDLTAFIQDLEQKGLVMNNISHKEVKEWVCQFIASSETPQIWFDETDERIFTNIHYPIVNIGTKHFFNPIIMQEKLANSDDENIRSIVINNPQTFTTFKIAAYVKYKNVK